MTSKTNGNKLFILAMKPQWLITDLQYPLRTEEKFLEVKKTLFKGFSL